MKQIPGQMNIFMFLQAEPMPKRVRRRKKNPSTLRNAWEQYGISKERYLELRDYCQNTENRNLVARTAYEVNPLIGEHIYQSVTRRMSYEGIEFLGGHRIPCGRSDFYGYRRMMFAKINEILLQEEKEDNVGQS